MSALRQTLLDAAEHHRSGRFAAAESGYRAVLAALPDQADALHLLGVLCHQTKRHDEAIALIERAIAADASSADFHSNLGEANRAMGRNAAAEAAYRQALAIQPDHVGALTNLGLVLCDLGLPAEAATVLRRAVTLKPDLAEAQDNLGIALQALGDLDGAAASHARSIALAPGYAKAHNNLGNVHFARDDLAAAADSYRRAIALDPGYAQAHYNLGNVFVRRDEPDPARESLERAIALKPGYFDAILNLCSVLEKTGQAERAIGLLRTLTADNPTRTKGHLALAGALANAAQFDDAEAAFRRAVALEPTNIDSWSNYLFSFHYRTDCPASRVRAVYDAFDASFGGPLRRAWRPHDNDRDPERRLRIGYVSPDFRLHSCAFFALPLFEAHDHAQVEVFAYAELGKPDRVTERFKAAADHWRETAKRSDDAVADMVRADRIDILVDLAGHTNGHRLPVFARKPAPVQATWLGYPGTTGLSAIDYRLTDAVADPPGAEADAVEQLIRLPRGFLSYEPAPDTPAVSPLPARAAHHITFGCFNNAMKINAGVVALWADVLRAVPDSRLIVKAFRVEQGNNRRRLESLFEAAGLPPGRVEILRHYGETRAHFVTYSEIDIALDPFPYNGTTTTCEGLWLGVPTITLRGDRHSGRVGASLLTSIGLGDLIAESPADYVAKAAALAGDLDRLAGLRAGMRARLRGSALMDYAGFARAMENAYRAMWRDWCARTAMTRGVHA